MGLSAQLAEWVSGTRSPKQQRSHPCGGSGPMACTPFTRRVRRACSGCTPWRRLLLTHVCQPSTAVPSSAVLTGAALKRRSPSPGLAVARRPRSAWGQEALSMQTRGGRPCCCPCVCCGDRVRSAPSDPVPVRRGLSGRQPQRWTRLPSPRLPPAAWAGLALGTSRPLGSPQPRSPHSWLHFGAQAWLDTEQLPETCPEGKGSSAWPPVLGRAFGVSLCWTGPGGALGPQASVPGKQSHAG